MQVSCVRADYHNADQPASQLILGYHRLGGCWATFKQAMMDTRTGQACKPVNAMLRLGARSIRASQPPSAIRSDEF